MEPHVASSGDGFGVKLPRVMTDALENFKPSVHVGNFPKSGTAAFPSQNLFFDALVQYEDVVIFLQFFAETFSAAT